MPSEPQAKMRIRSAVQPDHLCTLALRIRGCRRRSGRRFPSSAISGDVPAMLRAKLWRRAPRLHRGTFGGLLALLLCLIGFRRLKRGCRSDSGVVARETWPTIRWHGHRSLRLSTRAVQPRSVILDARRCEAAEGRRIVERASARIQNPSVGYPLQSAPFESQAERFGRALVSSLHAGGADDRVRLKPQGRP